MPFSRSLKFMIAAFLFALPSLPASAEILFDGEWDDFGSHFQRNGNSDQWFADGRPNRWQLIQETEIGRLAAVKDPTSPKHGYVARVEVRPGDNVGSWSGERAEVLNMMRWNPAANKPKNFEVDGNSGQEFYGLAVKLAPDWQSPGKSHGIGATWGIFLQLHAPNNYGASPPFALDVTDNFHFDYDGGDILDGGTRTTPRDVAKLPLSDGSLDRGHWVEFMIDVLWSYKADGHIVIYRRNEGERRFRKVLDMQNVPTLQSKYGVQPDDSGNYWKTGFYRSATAGVTNTIWLGPLARGTSFDEVARTAFGDSGQR